VVHAAFGRQFSEMYILSNLKFLMVKSTTVFKAQEIAEKYRLKPRDAIHAAAAIENKVSTIVSYDKDFDIIDEIKRIKP
jgi:predicted nucleic acid-binding protein